MPGNPFQKAAPRPNIRAKVSAPKRPKAVSTVPAPKQPMSPPKSAPPAKLGKIRVTTKAKRSLGAAKPRQGVIPGSTPGKPGSSPGASPGW
jgi:hypothetical protein